MIGSRLGLQDSSPAIRLHHSATPELLPSKRSAEFFEPVHPFLNHVQACRIAQADGSVVSEGDPRDHRHIRLAEQPIGKVLRGESKLADVDENVKCAARDAPR